MPLPDSQYEQIAFAEEAQLVLSSRALPLGIFETSVNPPAFWTAGGTWSFSCTSEIVRSKSFGGGLQKTWLLDTRGGQTALWCHCRVAVASYPGSFRHYHLNAAGLPSWSVCHKVDARLGAVRKGLLMVVIPVSHCICT